MRITKLEHATLLVTENDSTLVVDPGSFTSPIEHPERVSAIVVTHNHPDHWSTEHLDAIRASAPHAPIFAPAAVADAYDGDVSIVTAGDTRQIGEITLEFLASAHMPIHASVEVPENLGVIVCDTLLIPGDSFDVPAGRTIDVLAAPIGGPWLKIGDAMDFVLAVAPKRAFYVHDAPLSPIGLAMHTQRLTWAVEHGGGTFAPLGVGESIDVD